MHETLSCSSLQVHVDVISHSTQVTTAELNPKGTAVHRASLKQDGYYQVAHPIRLRTVPESAIRLTLYGKRAFARREVRQAHVKLGEVVCGSIPHRENATFSGFLAECGELSDSEGLFLTCNITSQGLEPRPNLYHGCKK
jgi:hypothetical protein